MGMLANVLALLTVLLAVAVNKWMNSSWPASKELNPIVTETYPVHPTAKAAGQHRLYLVAGGSGFVGSWIVRYLLMRGEKNVRILDRCRPPSDILKHGAIYHEVDLRQISELENIISRLNMICHTGTNIIVYNCSVIKRYYTPKFDDLGLQAAEALEVNLRLFTAQGRRVTLIHIGDTLCHRNPTQWWNPFTLAVQSSKRSCDNVIPFAVCDQSRSFTSYAWYQGAVENLTMSLSAPPAVATGSVRVDGYVSGHIGDGLLTPAFERNIAVIHNWGVPITLIHVEDVVRVALALEQKLLDEETRVLFSGRAVTVAGPQLTTFEKVLEYAKQRQRSLKIIHLPPLLVWVLCLVVSSLSVVLPSSSRSAPESMICGSWRTFTLARFATLQIGQIPDPHNAEDLKSNLNVKLNYSLSQIIDSVLNEIKEVKTSKEKRS